MKEWTSFSKYGVLEPRTKQQFEQRKQEDPTAALLPLKWVIEFKIIDGKKGVKARLVAVGTAGKDKREGVTTEVSLPNHRGLYTMLSYQVQQKTYNPHTALLQADLKNAFFQSINTSQSVFVRLPKVTGCRTDADQKLIDKMFSKDRIAQAVKTLYGTRDAPANLDRAVRKSMTEVYGFTESLSCPNLYLRFTANTIKYKDFKQLSPEKQQEAIKTHGRVLDCWVYVYVDDLMMGSGVTSAAELASELQKMWIFKEQPQPPSRFLGLHVSMRDHGIFIDQKLLADSFEKILPEYMLKLRGTLSLPLPRSLDTIEKMYEEDIAREGQPNVLSGVNHKKYRSLLGMMAYLVHTRADLQYPVAFFGQFSHKPTAAMLKQLMTACVYVLDTSNMGKQFITKQHRKTMGPDMSRIVQSEYKQHYVPKPDENGRVKAPKPPKPRPNAFSDEEWVIDIFPDATCKRGGEKAMTGIVAMLNKDTVFTKSATQRRRATSSSKYEGFAASDAVDVAMTMRVHLIEIGVPANQIATNIWCDANNVVTAVNSVNPSSVDWHSKLIARQIHRVLQRGQTIDAIRLLAPRLADIIEEESIADDIPLVDFGYGPTSRYVTAPRMKEILAMEQWKKEVKNIGQDVDTLLSIVEKMQDNKMSVIHIDGKNQLADGMTKMNTSIDYYGRLVFDKTKFEEKQSTPIRDATQPVSFRVEAALTETERINRKQAIKRKQQQKKQQDDQAIQQVENDITNETIRSVTGDDIQDGHIMILQDGEKLHVSENMGPKLRLDVGVERANNIAEWTSRLLDEQNEERGMSSYYSYRVYMKRLWQNIEEEIGSRRYKDQEVTNDMKRRLIRNMPEEPEKWCCKSYATEAARQINILINADEYYWGGAHNIKTDEQRNAWRQDESKITNTLHTSYWLWTKRDHEKIDLVSLAMIAIYWSAVRYFKRANLPFAMEPSAAIEILTMMRLADEEIRRTVEVIQTQEPDIIKWMRRNNRSHTDIKNEIQIHETKEAITRAYKQCAIAAEGQIVINGNLVIYCAQRIIQQMYQLIRVKRLWRCTFLLWSLDIDITKERWTLIDKFRKTVRDGMSERVIRRIEEDVE